MSCRQKLFLVSTLFFFASSAHAVPPGTVVCDNPAVEPDVIIRWGPISADLVNALAFDSTHAFIATRQHGAIDRLALNGENLESLAIFDVRGARVKTLVDRAEQAGVHRVAWDGTDNRGSRVSSGIYFYRLMAGSFSDTKRMVLLR